MEEVKQVPNVKTGRKRICRGAEAIDALVKIEADKKISRKSTKKAKSTSVIENNEESKETADIIKNASDNDDVLDEIMQEKENEVKGRDKQFY